MRRVALLLALVSLALPAAALAVTPRASFNDIEDEVMCVSCNVPLNIAESPQATQERDHLRKLVAQGLTKKQILDEMVSDYGPNVLAQPKGSGVGLWAWIVPIAAALGLIALGFVLLPRWRRARAVAAADGSATPATPPLADADARRLEEDLGRFGA